MVDMNYGKCDSCGKEAALTRIYEHFDFPCECHSSDHFIFHELCDECVQAYCTDPNSAYRMDPNIECMAQVSVNTFNLFLKAHGKYGVKYHHSLTCDDIHPEYITDTKPMIKIRCTYETMCYLGKIYSEYQYELALDAEKESKE